MLISLSNEPETAYLSRKLDWQIADHEENAADHFSMKMVIGEVTAVIG
jgi:hypothetical protein